MRTRPRFVPGVRSGSILGFSLLLAASVVTSPVSSADPDGRTTIAVDLFEVPQALRQNLAPRVLTDLLLDAGKKSSRYQQLAPNEYLRKVLDRYRIALQAGELNRPPEGVEPNKILADRMLLPSLSKIGEKYFVTAALIDMRTFKRIESYKLDGRGEDAVPGLIEDLWKKVDAARTRWTYAAGGPVLLGPVAAGDRVVLATQKHWACIDAATGRELWKHPVTQPPPIPADPKDLLPQRPPSQVHVAITEGAAVLLTHQWLAGSRAKITLESRDLATGKQLWTRPIENPFSRWLTASRSHLFYVEANYDLVALDALSGKEAWKVRLPAEKYDTYTLVAATDGRLYALHPNRFLCFEPLTGKAVVERPSIFEGGHHPVPRRVELQHLLQVGDRLYGYHSGDCYALDESGKGGTRQPLIPAPRPAGGLLIDVREEARPPARDEARVYFAAVREVWQGNPGLMDAKFERAELHVSARTMSGLIELKWHTPVASIKVRGRAVGPVVHGDLVFVGLGDRVFGLDRKTGRTVATVDCDPPIGTEMVLSRGAIIVGDTAGIVRAVEP